MEKKYYVNSYAQPNGDHEVHDENCYFLPEATNTLYLGSFFSCVGAVIEAKKYYPTADGCYYCSSTCHKR